MSEHSRKVLLRFEAAGHGDIQDARLRARNISFARCSNWIRSCTPR
jgi:hypothetical protein